MDTLDTATPAPLEPTTQRYNFEFTGDAKEYFRIWIVNVVFSILTLGIYSAWAKVRTRRYFLGNTLLAGNSFDFHADPVKILYGRILMTILLGGYLFGSKISPLIVPISGVVLLVLFPWVIVRGMMFNLANTSYRSIRFSFAKDYSGSYLNYFKCLLIVTFTFGIGFSWAMRRHWWFRLTRSRIGSSRFDFNAEGSEFFAIYFGAGLVYMGALALAFLAGFISKGSLFLVSVLPVFFIYAGILFAAAHVRAQTTNLVCKGTRLDNKISFEANLKSPDFFKLYLVNLIACLFTLGLMIPWAMVRTAKYRLGHMHMIAPTGSLDSFVAEMPENSGALADAAVDFWDIDLGF